MQEVCTGCLCEGRELYLIRKTGFFDLYKQILSEVPVQDMSTLCIRVCWECRASLRRFQLFKLQVKNCYQQLSCNIPLSPLPPRLTPTPVHSSSYPEVIKCELDIKQEVEGHEEPETFVGTPTLPLHEDHNKLSTKKSKKKPSKKNSDKRVKVKRKKSILFKKKEVHKSVDKDFEIKENGSKLEPYQSDSDRPLVIQEAFQEDDPREDDITEEETKEEEIREEDITIDNTREDKDISLKKELIVVHKAKAVVLKSKESVPQKPQCIECGKMFSSKKTYRYHLNVLHKESLKHPCPRCGKEYQWKSNLARHLRTHKAVDSGELYCSPCERTFASIATYKQHLRISRRHVSENEFNFTCGECGKKFVNKTRLRDHVDWEHLNKIKFRCNLCHKPFKCHTSLYVHLQNVHRDKDRKDNLCHVCGKSYQNAAKLKYHITAMHSGETPYQCAQCGAAFGWYSSLYRHLREVHYKMKIQTKKTKKQKGKFENEHQFNNINCLSQRL